MRVLKIRELLVFMSVMFVMVSCINEDDDYRQSYQTYGFLEIVGENYYINTDGGDKLEIKDGQNLGITLEHEDRVYSNFYIEEYGGDGSSIYAIIELASLIYVEYSDILTVNEESRDTLGRAKTGINTYSIYDNKLNLQIAYYKSDEDHQFTLSYDEENQIEGEKIKLELRNYNNGAEEGTEVTSRLSTFNLMKLLDLADYDGEGDIDFELITNKGTDDKYIYTFTYTPDIE